MKTLYFEDISEFVCNVSDKISKLNDENNGVSIIAKYEEAKGIIADFMCFSGYELKNIILESPDVSEYTDEFDISIINIDGINEIWCEPMKRDTGYFSIESTITYIFANCSSKVIKHCDDSAEVYEVIVELDDKKEENVKMDCQYCLKCCKKNDNEKFFKLDSGVTADWKIGNCLIPKNESTYVVNGKKVTEEEFDKAFREFEDKFNKKRFLW